MPFVGNSTFVTNPNGNLMALQRQSNCSLSLFDGAAAPVPESQ